MRVFYLARRTFSFALFCFLPVIVVLSFSSPVVAGNSIVTVGLYENAPKIFTDNGKPAGIFIDIIEHIAKQEGWQLRYQSGSWAECLDRLGRGEIDLMPDMAYSAERSRIFSFPKVPALSSWFQVYAPKGHSIHTLMDLNGKRILILDRSIQHEAFDRLSRGFGLNCTLVTVPDYDTMFAQVKEGKADVAVTNRFYGIMHAKKFGLEDTSILFEPSDLYFVATKGDPQNLLPALDKHLADLKANPQSMYYSSLNQWTFEQVAFRLPQWVWLSGGAALMILCMSLISSGVLRHQVGVRTRELRQMNEAMDQRIQERTAELAALNQEQQAIFESAGVGIVVIRNRVIVRCNRKLEEISGYGPGELIGQSTRIWYADERAYAAGGRDVYVQLARGETHRRSQQMIRKDGSLYWVRLSLCAFDPKDPVKGSVGIIEDITDERDAAELLRQAMEKATKADQIKSAFLATMSHELRTPLNSIIGFTGIMLQGLAGPLNEEQHKQMSMVQNSSRHLLALINDVLDISKIEAGQLDLACSVFPLRSSLEQVARLVQPQAGQKGLELTVMAGEDLGEVFNDRRRFEQVVLNLVNNAIKFTDKGFVHITCESEGDQVRLTVADSGVGMKPETMHILFQPFQQIDSGLSRKHEGTGLGLSICKRLIEKMGGIIDVQSRWGEGSTFTVVLPRRVRGQA